MKSTMKYWNITEDVVAGIATLFFFLVFIVILLISVKLTGENKQIICDANTEVALHETEKIYPAWKYECEGYTVIIVD